MTTLHPQFIGDTTLLSRDEFERLVQMAQQVEVIELHPRDNELSTRAMMELADKGGAFAFWHEEGEDVYTAEDGEPV